MPETKTNDNTPRLVKGAMGTEMIQLCGKESSHEIFTYFIPLRSAFLLRFDKEANEEFNLQPHPKLNSFMKEILPKVKSGNGIGMLRVGIFNNIITLGLPLVKETEEEETKLRDVAKSVIAAMIVELKKGLDGVGMKIDEESLTDPQERDCLICEITSNNLVWAAKR